MKSKIFAFGFITISCCVANTRLVEQSEFSILTGYNGVWGQSFTAPGVGTHLLLSIELGALFTESYGPLMLFEDEFIGPHESVGSGSSGFITEGMPDGLGGWNFADSAIMISGGSTYWVYYINPTRSGSSFFLYSDIDLYSGGNLYREDLNGIIISETRYDSIFAVVTATIPEPAQFSLYFAALTGSAVVLQRRKFRIKSLNENCA